MIESSNIEAEIAELSRQIDERRRALEEARGIVVEHKEAIWEVLSEKIFPGAPAVTQTQVFSPSGQKTFSQKSNSYLDALAPEEIGRVNNLIELVGKKGLFSAIKEAQKEPPFVLDAFHDALVDRLYEEMLSRGIIKRK